MNRIAQIFPKTGRISGPEVADGAKPDVPTTDRENEKKKHLTQSRSQSPRYPCPAERERGALG